MDEVFRPRELLDALTNGGVEFVIIGGMAVSAHGYPRSTRDIDVVPSPTVENLTRLEKVLKSLEARLVGVDADKLGIDLNAETMARGANFPLDTIHGRLDILQELRDAKLYEMVAKEAIEVELDGITVRVCSLDALKAMKKNSGRPQDHADLAELERVNEENRQ